MTNYGGLQFDQYILDRLIGRGGFSDVYRAWDDNLNRLVAIKVLHKDLTNKDLTKFFEEARIMANLRHPHIITVFEFSFVDEILISDFGIARFVQNTRSRAVSASEEDWVGTAIYMAPERFRGQPNPATDQYALGIILYEWLTGSYPFYGTKSEIIHQQIHTPPPLLRAISPDVSPAVEQVVLKALRKNPHTRFKSVQGLFSTLDEARHPSLPRSLLAFLRGYFQPELAPMEIHFPILGNR